MAINQMIKYTSRLVKALGDSKKVHQLQSEIEIVKQIADINWLRKKIETATV